MPETATAGPLTSKAQETSHFFPVSEVELYTVMHYTENPVARVLLVGPFGSERHHSYRPWVGWARYLANRHVEVLRFDYRGVGESGGEFEDMSFADWKEDVLLLARWLRDQKPTIPLVLHGLEVGALLAAAAFEEGLGDVLFLWSPPASAHQALRLVLLRWVAVDQLFKVGEDRRTASTYIRELEEGKSVDVDGYRWSAKLWRESRQLLMSPSLQEKTRSRPAGKRPVVSIELGKDAVPLIKGGPAVADEPRDFTSFFAWNWDCLFEALPAAAGGLYAAHR